MIYEEMRRELSELVRLIRLDEQYCAAVMSGKVAPDEEAKGQHSARAHRITEICNRYGIN